MGRDEFPARITGDSKPPHPAGGSITHGGPLSARRSGRSGSRQAVYPARFDDSLDGCAVVLHNEPKWRFLIGTVSAALIALCVLLILFEKKLNLSRFNPTARQDIALIIDGSTSMMMKTDGISNFQRAVDEARAIVKRAPRGHAFSLILAGPSPSGKILDPTTDRAELDVVLEAMTPLDGPMATYHALPLASLSLARGDNPAKQIILFTDEQDVGWETGKTARWNFLRDAF